jgi:serine/threonine protein kinase
MSGVISDDVKNTFGNMLGKNNISFEDKERIIDRLSADSGASNLARYYPRFTELANVLKTATVMMFDDTTGQIEINSVTERIKKIGGGAYGTIFLGDSGAVYKRIKMADNNFKTENERTYYTELFHRELYIEAFVQVVLQSDSKYGNNIARLEGIYKDTIVDETYDLHPSKRKYVYFYKMENVQYTFKDYVKTLPNVALTMATKFEELGSMLQYFMDTYGFFHRDLHGGNIMFDALGNIKLIDFGMSCISVNGIQYSVNNDECMSFDIFILITYLLEYNIVPELSYKFRELLSDDMGFDIFALMKRYIRPNEAVFHKSYFSYSIKPKIQPWSDGITSRFINSILPRLDPKGFAEYWSNFKKTLSAPSPVPITTIEQRTRADLNKILKAKPLANMYSSKMLKAAPKINLIKPAYRTVALPTNRKTHKNRKSRRNRS